jgi:hypothetical protein
MYGMVVRGRDDPAMGKYQASDYGGTMCREGEMLGVLIVNPTCASEMTRLE